jgi:hypothetical protein
MADQFELHQRWALRPRDLQRALLDVEPEIVHFCGHGEGETGIVLEDASGQMQLVSTAALSNLFGLCAEHVNCVVLNACYAEVQADAIVQHINYVIGMRQAVLDEVAIAFATGFYQGLGMEKSIEEAFKDGCLTIKNKASQSLINRKLIPNKGIETNKIGTPNHMIPVLKRRTIKL